MGSRPRHVSATEFNTPVIYLSAYSEDATLRRARATGPTAIWSTVHRARAAPLSRWRSSGGSPRMPCRKAGAPALGPGCRVDGDLGTQPRYRGRCLRPGRAARVSGRPRGSGRDLGRFLAQVHGLDRPALAPSSTGCGRANELRMEFRVARSRGRARWLRARGKLSAARAGVGRRIIGVIEDITEHRAAEEQLRQAATVFEATTDGILIHRS